jgi:hypothetical protein
MDKKRPSFAEDIQTIQGQVEADIGTILELAKHQRPTQSANESGPAQVTPNAKYRRHREAQVRRGRQLHATEEPARPLLQNVTTRLSHETNSQLTEAALRQRLNKATPATRQDIIEEAVQDWLRHHGYNRSQNGQRTTS